MLETVFNKAFIYLFIYFDWQQWATIQVFSCEFCEISKNTFFRRTPLVAGCVARTSLQTFPWEFFDTYKTISTAVSVAFMGSLKF